MKGISKQSMSIQEREPAVGGFYRQLRNLPRSSLPDTEGSSGTCRYHEESIKPCFIN
jgi:hypothetical protein